MSPRFGTTPGMTSTGGMTSPQAGSMNNTNPLMRAARPQTPRQLSPFSPGQPQWANQRANPSMMAGGSMSQVGCVDFLLFCFISFFERNSNDLFTLL